jgi:hypothetical protein
MVAVRLSQLQKRILRWLAAEHHRTHGVIVSSHEECKFTGAPGSYAGTGCEFCVAQTLLAWPKV